MTNIEFISPINGDCVNDRDGIVKDGILYLDVNVKYNPKSKVCINGISAFEKEEGIYTACIGISGYRNIITAQDEIAKVSESIIILFMPDAVGKYRISVDDNILFLRDITKNKDVYKSIFDNSYLQVYKKAHDLYGAKVHLNLFYEANEEMSKRFNGDFEYFNLSMMTDKFKNEFIENSNWLKLAFHSYAEYPRNPYKDTPPEVITNDCIKVLKEITRFAGKECISNSTTIHYGEATKLSIRALRNLGFRSFTGFFELNKDNKPMVSYYLDPELVKHVGGRDFWYDTEEDVIFGRIDEVLNVKTDEEYEKLFNDVINDKYRNGFVSLLIHEQYFYKNYMAYIPNFEERVLKCCKYLYENGYKGAHITEVTTENNLNQNRLLQ